MMALSLTQWQSRLVGKVTIYCGSFPNLNIIEKIHKHGRDALVNISYQYEDAMKERDQLVKADCVGRLLW